MSPVLARVDDDSRGEVVSTKMLDASHKRVPIPTPSTAGQKRERRQRLTNIDGSFDMTNETTSELAPSETM